MGTADENKQRPEFRRGVYEHRRTNISRRTADQKHALTSGDVHAEWDYTKIWGSFYIDWQQRLARANFLIFQEQKEWTER